MTIGEMELETADYEGHYNHIDATIATEEPCPDCSGPVKYRGFQKGTSYRAFFICEKCNKAEEF